MVVRSLQLDARGLGSRSPSVPPARRVIPSAPAIWHDLFSVREGKSCASSLPAAVSTRRPAVGRTIEARATLSPQTLIVSDVLPSSKASAAAGFASVGKGLRDGWADAARVSPQSLPLASPDRVRAIWPPVAGWGRAGRNRRIRRGDFACVPRSSPSRCSARPWPPAPAIRRPAPAPRKTPARWWAR